MLDAPRAAAWPPLPYDEWAGTLAALHRWSQVVGKIRLARTPWTNHSWHVTLRLSARGLTTGTVHGPGGPFEVELDLVSHRLRIRTTERDHGFDLGPMSVSRFHEQTLSILRDAGVETRIHPAPNEIEGALPFSEDVEEREYDEDAVLRFFRALASVDRVFKVFRARYVGKCSPVHFFWGSFDHAVTRFTGREAPPHPGGIPALPDWVTREAYSHEVSSAGFWPGGPAYPAPVFYSYAYPTPDGFSRRAVAPNEAFWLDELGEFLLPYEAVRTADDPADTLLTFLQESWEAAAETGGWDRKTLEWSGDGVPADRRVP